MFQNFDWWLRKVFKIFKGNQQRKTVYYYLKDKLNIPCGQLHSLSIGISIGLQKPTCGVYAKWALSRTLPPLKIHTNMHTCQRTDKMSTTTAPNVFAHWLRLTALPHWTTWTIYSDAPLNPMGNLDWDWKKGNSDTTWKPWGREGKPDAETGWYMSLSLNITVSL